MISRHRDEAIRAAIWFAGSAAAGTLCVAATVGMQDPAWGLGVLLAVGAVCGFSLAAVYYCHAILCLARAKGYSAAFFTSVFAGPFLGILLRYFAPDSIMVMVCMAMGPLLPLLLAAFMPDQGNAARDLEESRYAGARCVQCSGRIPSSVKLCPLCGYTQPSGDVAADSGQHSTPTTAPAV